MPANFASHATDAAAERNDEETRRSIQMAICATRPRDDPTTVLRTRPACPTPTHTVPVLPPLQNNSPLKTPGTAPSPSLRHRTPRITPAKRVDCGAFPSNCTCQATFNTRLSITPPLPASTNPTSPLSPISPRTTTREEQAFETPPVGSDNRLDLVSERLHDESEALEDTTKK
jgi:hypothetical protein